MVRDRGLIAGISRYPTPFTCAVAQSNLFAVQFHPEKSQAAGLQLLSNFVHWDGAYAPVGLAAQPRAIEA